LHTKFPSGNLVLLGLFEENYEDNIKIDLEEIGFWSMDWFCRDQGQLFAFYGHRKKYTCFPEEE
jgi:hypothetical protein